MTKREDNAAMYVYLACLAFLSVVLGIGIYLVTYNESYVPDQRMCTTTGLCEQDLTP